MYILGIDPGISRMGWGVVKLDKDNNVVWVDGGCITTKSGVENSIRYWEIFTELEKIILKYKIKLIGLEKVFFAKNVKNAIITGEARGVVLMIGGKYDIPIIEYTPNEMKMMVTGYGNSSKEQIQAVVKLVLNLDFIPQPDDHADALAIAYITARGYNRD
ncbi:MAG TPA: crossover junction endodeoxyribonuclease RuvC [Candidatus Dojkabacteria bacterium]|nr:crossover junction endodeoxyribonuclease RuvC [Candidatus Dojkabacteria bacterium]HQF36093.1 crossover junction endodeoxyribonuclease RuvC [Candidatus Dojkabacteria bacterium]